MIIYLFNDPQCLDSSLDESEVQNILFDVQEIVMEFIIFSNPDLQMSEIKIQQFILLPLEKNS